MLRVACDLYSTQEDAWVFRLSNRADSGESSPRGHLGAYTFFLQLRVNLNRITFLSAKGTDYGRDGNITQVNSKMCIVIRLH